MNEFLHNKVACRIRFVVPEALVGYLCTNMNDGGQSAKEDVTICTTRPSSIGTTK